MAHGAGSGRDPGELGSRMASGDKVAAYEAFDRYGKLLLSKLKARFGRDLDPVDREEVIAKVLGRFINKPTLYRQGSRAVAGYLVQCVLREGAKMADKVGYFRRISTSLGNHSPMVAQRRGERGLDADQERWLKGLIARLRPRHQEVINHMWEYGDQYSNILAVKTGEQKGALHTRLNRALAELRSLIRADARAESLA